MSNKKNGKPSIANPNHGPTKSRGKVSIGDRAYIVGRNSASHAMRTIIRNFYSNRPYDDKSLCTAVVISKAFGGQKGTWWDDFWSWVRPTQGATVRRYKVRIIDDPRHTCLPVPTAANSVECEMYPWVYYTGPEDLNIGAIVTMQFNDRGMQNNPHPSLEMGTIVDVLDGSKKDLKDIFSNCVPPRPVKGKKKTSVGKACIGATAAIPTRKFIPPPKIPAGTDPNKIVLPMNPVTGTPAAVYTKPPLPQKGTPDPNKVISGTETAVQLFKRMFVTSPVGPRHSTGTYHSGIDMKAKMKAPIFAALEGTVHEWKADANGYGEYLILKHDQYKLSGQQKTFYTLYAHMTGPTNDPVSQALTQSATVTAGQQIGTSGATGKCIPPGPSGAHLHFEVLFGLTYDANSEALDPMQFFYGEGVGFEKV